MSLSLHCVVRCAYVSVASLTLCDDSVLMSLWLFSHCVMGCAYVSVASLTLCDDSVLMSLWLPSHCVMTVCLCLCGYFHTVW